MASQIFTTTASVAEDVAEAGRDDRVEPTLLDGPHGVLARRAHTEGRAGHEDGRTAVALVVEDEVAVVAPRREQALLEPGALDALEPFGGDGLVGVDVAAAQRYAAPGDDTDSFHDRTSRSDGVAKWPATAVAAATAGLTRWVRPPRP
jgi:hypothetical protein